MAKAVTPDPAAENGFSEDAAQLLAVACEALAKQMSEDCKAGTLDQDRIELLIGGGPGAAAVWTALEKFMLSFP